MNGSSPYPSRRSFDLIAALLGWFLVSPLLALVALAIRLESPGPVVFTQARVGAVGRLFRTYKFRSMRTDAAPPADSAPPPEDLDSYVFTPDRPEPRITPLGRALRRTSFDELLQLVNVIRGDMALVGPRPEMPELVRRYPTRYHRRETVLPGITGLAQVNGRSDLTYGETIRYDLAYVKARSFPLDLAILGRTLSVVLRSKGAR